MAFFSDSANAELNKSGSSFYEFEQGQNEFRIVSDFAWGYKFNFASKEEAKEKKYPFYKMSAKEVEGNQHKLIMTASMVVYDYKAKQLMSLNMHQKNILKTIRDYVENEKYGDPTGYDLIVTKTGEGRDTSYSVIANPPEAYSKEVEAALKDVTINVENVFDGESAIVEKK